MLGLGTMGAPMVENLVRAGHRVRGWNRTARRAAALEGLDGFVRAQTPASAARDAEVVFVCVSDDGAVHEVLADGAVFGAVAPGAIVVDCGTTSLDTTRRLAQAAASAGVRFVDAPVTGSKLGAQAGTLTFMVGGAPETVAALEPYFSVLGAHVVHVGDVPGAGQAAKACLNMTQAIMLEGILEGLVLARRLDVPIEKMLEIFEHSAARSGIGAFKAPYLLRRDFEPHFRLDLMQKDLHLALAEAARRRIPLPAACTVTTLYDQAAAEGLGAEDFLATVQLLERWARTGAEGGDAG